MPKLNNGSELKNKDYGPGGVNNRPFRNRYINIRNNNGRAIFIPDSRSDEQARVYAHVGAVPGVTAYKGKYVSGNTHHDPKAIMGIPSGSPCWSPATPANQYRTPAGCSSGFSDAGVSNLRGINPNQYNGSPSVQHGTLGWEFYQDKPYGCPGNFRANISVRRCQRT